MSAPPDAARPARSAPGVHPKPLLELPAPLRPRGGRRHRLQLPPPLVPGQDLQAVARLELLVLARHGLGARCFLLLVLSGLPLLFLYVPSVERAYGSVKDIEFVVTFGSWIRAVHRIAAHLMVAVVFLHLVARLPHRRLQERRRARPAARVELGASASSCSLLTLFLSFTGYLLPWDQLAYWAVTVGTNIAVARSRSSGPQIRELLIGGRTIDQATLIRFYVLHVIVLPAGLGALFAYHMWRIRKDGGLAQADRVDAARRRRREAPAREDEDLHAARRRARARRRRSGPSSLEARRHDRQLGPRPDAARRRSSSSARSPS